jgi:hypothetical protein
VVNAIEMISTLSGRPLPGQDSHLLEKRTSARRTQTTVPATEYRISSRSWSDGAVRIIHHVFQCYDVDMVGGGACPGATGRMANDVF